MILRITQYGEPILRKVGEPITEFDQALDVVQSTEFGCALEEYGTFGVHLCMSV